MVYRRGVIEIKLCYRAGRENRGADALSRSPQLPAPEVEMVDGKVQVFIVTTTDVDPALNSSPSHTGPHDDVTSELVASGGHTFEQSTFVGSTARMIVAQGTGEGTDGLSHAELGTQSCGLETLCSDAYKLSEDRGFH